MANPKMDILWSPIHADKFITFGNELRLFQIEYITDRNGRAQRSSAGFILPDVCPTARSILLPGKIGFG